MFNGLTIAVFFALQLCTSQFSFARSETGNSEKSEAIAKRSANFFPILMYDSDIGFGFGGKGLVKNLWRKSESFDLILFGSSKGEQWYLLVFSIPDFEIRQGKAYPLALDLKLEFDKYLKSNFFGFGNISEDNDWQFPKESTKLELTLGRAFTEQLISEVGLFFNHVSVYGFEGKNPLLSPRISGVGEHVTSYVGFRLRWDTRDSQIHPHKGWKMGCYADFAVKSLGGDFEFQRYRLEVSKYQHVFNPAHMMAVRLWAQHVEGTAPYYEQSIIGGGWTLRGYKVDRFIDRALLLASAEYRPIIYKALGGVLFLDTGRVCDGLQKGSFQNWKTNWGAGLRYYLANFVVRFDAGFSPEGTRIFFNFGHVF